MIHYTETKGDDTMGMSDAQFKAYIRAMMLHTQEAREETDPKKKDEKLDAIIKNYQQSLED